MKPTVLAYASLSICGDAVSPEFWTRYFGVEPDLAFVKGEPFSTLPGRTAKRRTGAWGVRSKSAIHSDLLDPHFRYLIKHLGLPRDDLRDLVCQANAEIRLFCYWNNYSGDRIPDVATDISQMIGSLGGIIDIDEYPQKHRFLKAEGYVDVWV